MMKRLVMAFACAFMLCGNAADSRAQVKRVEMHLTRYLCNSCAASIGKAISRLEFAPPLNEILITDVLRGVGAFAPKSDVPASFASLQAAIKRAGYTLYSAEITVKGTVERDASGWWVVASGSGQRFSLKGPKAEGVLAGLNSGTPAEITGDWKTRGKGTTAVEEIALRVVKDAAIFGR